MISDPQIREQGYIYFLNEAPELLQQIEQDLLTLAEDCSTAKVHSLMRATHTLKGGAANVGLEVIKTVAHSLEDVIKAFYNPNLVIDSELQTLLMRGYECLRAPLMAELTGSSIDNEEVLNRTASVFAQLQTKLGDYFGDQAYIPSSVELGFDVARSLFEMGVGQRLESIAALLVDPQVDEVATTLRSQAEVFVGLAESLNLLGFKAIAQTTLAAIDAHPDKILTIAEVALDNFRQGREAVLAGDRIRGGEPSQALLQLAGVTNDLSVNATDNQPVASPTTSLENQLDLLYQFLTGENATTSQEHHPQNRRELLKPEAANFYIKIIRYILGWFHHELGIPQEELKLGLLVPHINQTNTEIALKEAEETVNYLQDWVSNFLGFLNEETDSHSLYIYRERVILATLLAVAKFQYIGKINNLESYRNIPVIQSLNRRIREIAKEYKKHPPVTDEEKKWVEQPKLQNLLVIEEISASPAEETSDLLEEIWGGETYPEAELVQAITIQNQQQVNDYALSTHSVLEEGELVSTIPETIEIVDKPARNIQKSRTDSGFNKTKNFIPRQSVRVDLEGLEHLNYLAGELLNNENRQGLQDDKLKQAVQKVLDQLRRHQETLTQLQEWSEIRNRKSEVSKFSLQKAVFSDAKYSMGGMINSQVKIKLSDFDSLELDQYTELNLLLHSAWEETLQLKEATESIDLLIRQSSQNRETQQRLLSSVRDELIEARMSPMENIFSRFTQMVENLANMHGKLVELKLSGTQVLVDKAIAEKLYEPLLHLVRNAFDHGIETPEVRRQRGKPEKGLIEIRAYHQGNQTIIEVRDDGQGLDLDLIRHRGIELNLLPTEPHLNTAPTESQLLELLFEPGFSTASELSDLSGRGIGLDVVRSQLHALKGSVTVQSSPQQGTSFLLQIPFSMTTAKLLVVQAGGAIYALLLETIEKILLPNSQEIKQFEGKKVLHWGTGNDGCMVRVRQLSDLMEYQGSLGISKEQMTDGKEQQTNTILLLRRNTELLGLEVDQILAEQELVIRPLGSAIAPPQYIYGCSIWSDGRLILVIDGAVLVNSGDRQQATNIMLPPTAQKPLQLVASTVQSQLQLAPSSQKTVEKTPQKPSISKRILVVDDSMSQRQTLTLTLQKYGYHVLQAQDGLEAIEKLQQNPGVGVVLCDLEMPRLNGFELLSNVGQDPDMAKIPVIIITSRSAEKHRQLAHELGAKAYFTKPYSEDDLIGAIAGFMNAS